MGAKNGKKERRQMQILLERIADLAEHAHHTGAFEEGAELSVQRYNRIVKNLEGSETIPAEMFPVLPENASFSRLGAECRLLVGYLEEYGEEDDEEDDDRHKSKSKGKGGGTIDGGVIAAMAPFLGKKDLAHLVSSGELDAGVLTAIAPFMEQEELGRVVRQHFPARAGSGDEEAESSESSQPDLKAIASMAPFLDRETLTELVRSCLARDPAPNPKRFAELAPFLPREVFSELLRTHFPHWFGTATPAGEGESSEKRAVLAVKPEIAADK